MSGFHTASRLPPWLGPCSVAVGFVLLAHWSWGKWTDVHVDFGNELYIPWQLCEGKALYRDIAHRNGPLSHYLNALWFALFGVSVRTLVLCNLAILAATCAMIYRVFRQGCGGLTATVTCLTFLGLFAFSQYVGIGNFNYVTPYQHTQTHGVALSIGMILALSRALRCGGAGWCALAGGCLGLVGLTKAELAVPALATAGLGMALILRPLPRDGTGGHRAALAFTAAALLPVSGFSAFLGAQMPLRQALRGVLGNWGYLGTELFSDRFYAAGSGLDHPAENLWIAVRMAAAIGGFGALAAGAECLLPPGRRRALWSAAAGLALFALLVGEPQRVPWAQLARALPLVALAAAIGLALPCLRSRTDRDARHRRAPLALWSVWALFLLGKMILNARFGQYGFALAMPATLLLVAGLLELPPAVAGARRGGGWLARALGLAAIAAGLVFFLRWSDRFYQRKDLPVGSGADRILAESPGANPRAQSVALALERLEGLMEPGTTLLVLPEGISLNYWLRRENPSRYPLFLPTEFDAFGGEEAMLEDIRLHPPDFVALVHRRHQEFGVGPFGVDPNNGRRIVRWVEEHYRRVALIGAEPFRDHRFGIVLLERRPGASR